LLLRPAVAALIWAVLIFHPAWAADEDQSPLAPPPPLYRRIIQIEVSDLAGRPLSGVKAEIKPVWGRLVSPRSLASNKEGLITFEVQPVIEDPLAGLLVRDRFLLYRIACDYTLSKEDYLTLSGRIEDRQEFASLADPVYQGLDRRPTADPLTVRVRLPAYRDYLARAHPTLGRLREEKNQLRTLVDRLQRLGRDRGFSLVPGSLDLSETGLFQAGFEFQPLFDPAEMGLLAAGAVLMREVVVPVISILDDFFQGRLDVESYEISVGAGFQYRAKPFALPEVRTFVFRLPASAAAELLTAEREGRYPLEKIEVTAGGQVLDLTAELNPEEIRAAPGGMLTSPETGKKED